MIVLKLPYPVSANRYWRPVHIGNHITIVPTKEAKEYRETVGWIAKAAGVKLLAGRVAVDIKLYPHRPLDFKKRMREFGDLWDDSVMRLDLDNARKVVNDALKNIAFEDDKRIFKDTGEVMEPDGREACLIVTITPYIRSTITQRTLALPPVPVVPVEEEMPF